LRRRWLARRTAGAGECSAADGQKASGFGLSAQRLKGGLLLRGEAGSRGRHRWRLEAVAVSGKELAGDGAGGAMTAGPSG
jgi:hypothetical protein